MLKKTIILLLVLFSFVGKQTTAQIQVGDTLPFWSVSYIDWPPLWGTPQWQIQAVCLRAGQYCYIFSEIGISQPAQSELDTMMARFENHYAPTLIPKYGPIPAGIDNDQHVFILNMADPNWGGYFDPGQGMSDSMVMATWNRHSSEHEIIYHAAFGSYLSPPVVAHEFGHLLHWGQDHSPEPPVNPIKYWEEAWVDEGFSTFAELYLDENIYQHNVNSTNFVTSSSDIPLIYFSSYNQVKLFMLYMYEHYGNWDYISTLISNQLNGINGVESTLDILGQTDNFNDAFANWCVANFIDDTVYANGKYSYAHYNFGPAHVTTTHSTYPTGLKTGTVTAYGSDYIRLNTAVPFPIDIEFEGEANKAFRLAVIKQNTSNNSTVSVEHLLPDANNHISYVDFTFGTDHNRTILVPMCIDSTVHEGQSAMYTYQVSGVTGLENRNEIIQLELYPNPTAEIIHIPWIPMNGKEIELSVYDISGREVIKQNANQSIRELNVQELTNGMYFLKIKDSGRTILGKFVKQ